MIVLHYKDLATTPLVASLKKLNDMAVFDGRTAYRIHKMYAKVFKEYQKSGEAYNVLGIKYAKKTEQGFPELNERGHYVPEPDKEEEYGKELEKLMNTKIVIDQQKLNIDHLTTRFAPNEIAALAPLVDGLED